MLGLSSDKHGYGRWTCDVHAGNQSCDAPTWNVEKLTLRDFWHSDCMVDKKCQA